MTKTPRKVLPSPPPWECPVCNCKSCYDMIKERWTCPSHGESFHPCWLWPRLEDVARNAMVDDIQLLIKHGYCYAQRNGWFGLTKKGLDARARAFEYVKRNRGDHL